MQPGSQRVTSEQNNTIEAPSGERCLLMGWLDIQHKSISCARVSGLYDGLPALGDTFVNNRYIHVSGDAEDPV